jgi:autotransporter translocation and assembly factor TamB
MSWGDGQLELSGEASRENGPRLKLAARFPLDPWARWIPGVARLSGRAELEARLEGGWAEPQGRLLLQLPALEFRAWPDAFNNISARLRFDERGLEVVSLEGRLGEGRFDAYGRLGWKPLHLALNFALDGVRTRITPSLWAVASGSLQLGKSPGARLKLEGDLQIAEGGYREKFNLASFSQGLFRRRVKTARSYSAQREVLDFDLKIDVPDHLRVEYDLGLVKFQAEMQGQLKITGTNERLGVLGELQASEGVINYLTKDFSLIDARVEFGDPLAIEPEVRLSAERTEILLRPAEEGGTVEYRLRLDLSARGDSQPQVRLSSDPPLDERDVVALLNLGVTTRDLENLKSEDLLGLGGEILSRSLQFDERLGRFLPLPAQLVQPRYVRIRSSYSTSGSAQRTGTVSPRLEVGAKLKLGGSDFDVDYGRSLYDGTDQNVDLSWRISPRMSARLRWEGGEKDTPLLNVGDLGLDLRFHWEW